MLPHCMVWLQGAPVLPWAAPGLDSEPQPSPTTGPPGRSSGTQQAAAAAPSSAQDTRLPQAESRDLGQQSGSGIIRPNRMLVGVEEMRERRRAGSTSLVPFAASSRPSSGSQVDPRGSPSRASASNAVCASLIVPATSITSCATLDFAALECCSATCAGA